MSISYTAIKNSRAKATLPSVSSWGNNNSILKNGPQSITTRRIDKVGDTVAITAMNAESQDRWASSINMFARGVDPMGGGMFQNASTRGANGQNGSIQQASLPYKVNEAFRPPITAPQQLLPLSRQPRIWTSAFTQPGFADFSKKMMIPNENDNTIGAKKNIDILRTSVQPTKYYHRTSMAEEINTDKYIQMPIRIEAFSGKRTMDLTEKVNVIPSGNKFNTNHQQYEVDTNIGSNVTRIDTLQQLSTDKYIQDSHHIDVNSNTSRYKMTSLDDIAGYTDVRLKDNMILNVQGNKSGNTKTEYIHNDIEMNRNLPVHEVTTNKNISYQTRDSIENHERYQLPQTRNIPLSEFQTNQRRGGNIDMISSRNYSLKPTISVGGYSDSIDGQTLPSFRSDNDYNVSLNSDKNDMSRKVYEMQTQRVI